MLVQLKQGVSVEALGLIPSFLDQNDPRLAKEQFDANYQHGGGWFKYDGFEMDKDHTLLGKGDPPLKPIATMWFRDERIFLYRHAWVAIVQPDETFEVARMD
jgi:hypothetical protein